MVLSASLHGVVMTAPFATTENPIYTPTDTANRR